VRELNLVQSTRNSRASSVISTRTRFSTTTIQDDAQSIDIAVGGQYFRISRDGSRITDAPPPYSGPLSPRISEDMQRHSHNVADATRSTSRRRGDPVDPRAVLLSPIEVDMPSPVHDLSGPAENRSSRFGAILTTTRTARLSDRSASYNAGTDTSSANMASRQNRTAFHNGASTWETGMVHNASPLRRRNGVRLPSLVTGGPSQRDRTTDQSQILPVPATSPQRPSQTQSAGPVLMVDPDVNAPLSPTYIGRSATGTFPNVTDPWRSSRNGIGSDDLGAQNRHTTSSSIDGSSPTTVIDAADEAPATPLAMDTENDISLHYTRMIRRLDRDHRKALHEKDKELAQYRQYLHEKDTVYRQELKSRDFIIDDLKKRLEHMQDHSDSMLERARNQVEDMWESRWKDRDCHLREMMRRMEEEHQKVIERMRAGPPEDGG